MSRQPTEHAGNTSPRLDARRTSRAILSEEADIACAGAISIAIFWPLVVFGFPGANELESNTVATARLNVQMLGLSAVLNFPHFFASYWLVYRSRESTLRHKWASIYLPSLTGLWCIGSVALSAMGVSSLGVYLIYFASGVYLAWHYTGQAWGMMVSFSILEETPFAEGERRWLRGSLLILLVWHVAWVFNLTPALGPIYDVVHAAFPFFTAGIGVSFAIGSIGFLKMSRRTGRRPAARILVPWLAIYCWYALMARYPFAIILVRLAHALQYLPFTARVELNRARASGSSPRAYVIGALGCFALALLVFFGVPQIQGDFPLWISAEPTAVMGLSSLLLVAALWFRHRPVPVRMLSLGVIVLIGGCSLFWFLVAFVTQSLVWLLDMPPEVLGTVLAITAFLNIHHYFADGVLWKLRNPEVRGQLFAHLEPKST